MTLVVIVVVEVLLVVGGREMGYRGLLADAHPGRVGYYRLGPRTKPWTRTTGGHGRAYLRDVFFLLSLQSC